MKLQRAYRIHFRDDDLAASGGRARNEFPEQLSSSLVLGMRSSVLLVGGCALE